MSYTCVAVTGRLVLNGVEIAVSSCSVTYAINTIPIAAFGILSEYNGGTQSTGIQTILNQAKAGDPVEFYLSLTYGAGIVPNLPNKEFQLFRGKFMGLSHNMRNGAWALVLHARHWLGDLDDSSALSASVHPTNPAQFSFNAATAYSESGSSALGYSPFTTVGQITATTLADDFWAQGLKPWLLELTQLDRINSIELGFLGAPTQGDVNAEAALRRFTETAGNYKPLRLDLGDADADAVAESILNDVQRESFDSFGTTTIWDKLVNDFAARFLFAVVPRVDDALVVPYIPGLRKPWRFDIAGTHQTISQSQIEVQRLLRGVGVFGGIRWDTGANLMDQPQNDSARLGIGGWWSPPGQTDGMVLLRNGPRWLTNIISPSRYSSYASGAGAKPISSLMHPAQAVVGPLPVPATTLKKTSKYIMDAYAHSLYAFEQLRLRVMSLATPIRLDICPGSTIRFDITDAAAIRAPANAKYGYADVRAISFEIDTQRRIAQSNFSLAHVRTSTENTLDAFSLDRPPLWKDGWSGAGLLAQYD